MNIHKDQKLNLEEKIAYSKELIKEWYEKNDGKVFVSFSGGKDSVVLLDLVRSVYKEVPAVFIDTGMEYPEIVDFVKSIDNLIWLKHEKNYKEIVESYGYPVINKAIAYKVEALRAKEELEKELDEVTKKLLKAPFKVSNKCCEVLKAENLFGFIGESKRKPIVGIMAAESLGRARSLMKYGYNGFTMDVPTSHPMGFWLEEDVIRYIKTKNLSYSKIYGDLETYGERRTNCMFCLYGCDTESEPTKFQRMKISHPNEYNYAINELGIGKVFDYLDIKY